MTGTGGWLVVTVSVAASLVRVCVPLETITRNVAPLSESCADGSSYVADVAPGMFVPLRCHWYDSAPVPAAWTENVARRPTDASTSSGCTVMFRSDAWPAKVTR